MKIVIDADIPFIKGVFEPYVEVCYIAGKQISRNDVKNADALVVRTRTRCDAALLSDSNVRFIASATIGYDHIDAAWCAANGIMWSNAIGCNAESVGQYVLAALLEIAVRRKINLSDMTIGIVGVGHVGSVVQRIANALQMRVLLNDPPRAEKEGCGQFVSLDTLTAKSDIVTIHTPLSRKGAFSTYHLVDHNFLQKLKQGVIFINTSRGEVVDETALKTAIFNKHIAVAVLDVWENEPCIDAELLSLVDIATPHIAGYSTDGKARATEMVVHSVAQYFNLPLTQWKIEQLPIPEKIYIDIDFINNSLQKILEKAVPLLYDILYDDNNLRADFELFEEYRRDYRLRREFSAYRLKISHLPAKLRHSLFLIGFKGFKTNSF